MVFDPGAYSAFFDDITENGFHIFSRRLAQSPGFYPNRFPAYPPLEISDINEGDRITVRAFFKMDTKATPRIDSGQIDLEVEYVDHDAEIVFANILTELPARFPLSKGTSIELDLDEILLVQTR